MKNTNTPLSRLRAVCLVAALASLPFACAYPEYTGFDQVPGADAAAGSGGALQEAGPDTADVSGGAGGTAGTGGLDAGGEAGGGGVAGGGGCSSNNDCTAATYTKYCELKSSVCVECLQSTHCAKGQFCSDKFTCDPGCNDDTDCFGSSGGAAGSAGSGDDSGTGGADASDDQTAAGGASGEDASADAEDEDAFAGTEGGGTGGDDASDEGQAGAAGDVDADADADLDAGDGDEAEASPTGDGGALVCNVATHTCQGCVTDSQCPPGLLCSAGGDCVPGCVDTHPCQAGHVCCSGECANTAVDPAHCGSCETACNTPGVAPICENGACKWNKCADGFADCDKNASNGCEVNTATDPNHCGACDTVCSLLPHGAAGCADGKCGLGTCESGFDNCDNDATNGCETNLDTTVEHCSACGHACELANALESCASGVCGIASCAAGFENCDQQIPNGCEVDLQTDAANCGTCNHVCTFAGGTGICQGGTCKLDTCVAPTLDCNADTTDGCEVDSSTDVHNCGSCQHNCVTPNATPVCSSASCAIGSCNSGYADCDGLVANGCEVKLDSDPQHCNDCNTICSTVNGTASCVLGACQIACKTDWADCDNDVTSGCETDIKINVDHCGTCTTQCSASGGTPNCTNGVCGISSCQGTLADCNADTLDGCEINTAGDVNNCGGCGKKCFVNNGTPVCMAGVCAIEGCNPGFENCNGVYQDGCEASLKTLSNCGACANLCMPTNGKGTCATGTCQIASCITPYGDCDLDALNGCETDTSNTVTACGACGNLCNSTNGTPGCQDSGCVIVCNSGFGNCNASTTDGCETALTNNVNNCGACGNACQVSNGQPTCNGTVCGVLSCTAPYQDCDLQYATGCETNLSNGVMNCGACGKVCNSNNGTPSCVSSACQITCSSGFGNCDNNADNGCESNTNNDPLNCSTCGHPCDFANAVGICASGTCVLGACLSGFGDCDSDAANGCETDLKSSVNNCDKCGAPCKLPNANNVCVNSVCGIQSCIAPWADCDGNPTNGCETNTSLDPLNCSACGQACSTQNGVASCSGSACGITCNPGYANCDGQINNGCEINTKADVNNCDTCGHICSATGGTPFCANGTCGVTDCQAGLGDCDGSAANGCETNLTNSLQNCATCGNACSLANGTAACVSSACTKVSCNAGFDDCNNQYADGCETNLKTNANCGACSNACTLPNSVATCATGTCLISSCQAGWGNCDGTNSNGCETDTNTSVANCGDCAAACSTVNGTPNCSAGKCSIACSNGWGNCDADPSDGCETQVTNDVNHCGSCSTVCAVANGTPGCVGTNCTVQSCTAPYKDCNAQYSDGCEVNSSTSVTNCGACGNVCNGTNGTASCASGSCSIACTAGYGNCDGLLTNGCESNLNTDVTHCGICTKACSFANASSVCSSGICNLGACNANYGDCDANPVNGCETSLTTTSNCGTCGNACSNAHGSTACTAGACVPTCAAGWGNCDGSANNGCETSVYSITNCGTCGKACSFANAAATCPAGTCQIGTCSSGWGNCDGNAANGCETNTNTAPANCGVCGTVCNSTNGTATCSGGTCGITCNSGYGNCDNNASNGCEANLSNDAAHCGNCTTSCTFANAAAVCFGGSCQLGACNAGYGNCDGNASNGCETQLTSLTNCGACGQVCSLANATPTCSTGTCAVSSCNAGFGNCDGNAVNGCETNTNTSTANCGTCGTVCNSANGTASCTSGSCSITCSSGFGNCNSSPLDGCEVSLNTTSNCGACGTACSNANGSTTCTSGACTPSCSAGFASCDGNPNNGCETNVLTSAANCGTCGTTCLNGNGSTSCVGGACTPVCAPGYGNCDGNANNGCETNTAVNPSNCGTCGNSCTNANGTTTCTGGACVPTCSTGWGDCDGNANNGCETNKLSNVNNCGTCGNVCTYPGGTPSCNGGVCGGATCAAGTGDCDGNTGNGCETSLKSLANCGGCGIPCAPANSTPSCSTGACAITSCSTGFGNCDAQVANGCETNTQTNAGNCGTCGTVCSSTNGSATCTLGACSISCNSGYGNCDGSAANGCEAALTTVAACGSCTTACTNANGGTACVSGVCSPTCNAGYLNCDGNPNNGCETNKNTSTTNCGACGTVCANAHGSVACSSGVCAPGCTSGWGNCDGNPNNGCETDTSSNINNCGACGTICTNANGTTTCTSSACVPTCSTGYGNCDGNAANGCETNTQTSSSNCGACGTVCSSINGTASCALGSCSITCTAGYGNCNGTVSDGCEVPLNTTTNCGACGAACSNTHGTTVCSSGACYPSCSSGYGNCDGNASNGCETALTSLTNCGGCGVGCSLAHATATCSTGVCGISACASGWGDCNSTTSDGCETATTTTSNCGACGTVCVNANGTTACNSGVCSPTCNSGWGNCDSNGANGCESNLSNDPLHCGGCTTTCTFAHASALCVSGACQIGSCAAGWGNCDGNAANGCETDLTTTSNCGTCGNSCSNANGGTACVSGTCAPTCNTNYGDCNGNKNDGCETSLTTTGNCGSCGTVCARANANTTCSTGTCQVASCYAGFANCDGNSINGCEISTQTDLSNCGACGTICSNAHGTPGCSLGSCTIACNGGYGNCDGNAQSNGCEASLTSDPNHCGTCTTVCTGGMQKCQSSVCVIGCPDDAWEPNETINAPGDPPMAPAMKKFDSVNNEFPISGTRTVVLQPSFGSPTDIDTWYLHVVDDLGGALKPRFNITLDNVPAGAVYTVDSYFHCDNTVTGVAVANWDSPATCPAVGNPNSGMSGWWFHCAVDATSTTPASYHYGNVCNGSTSDSGILQVKVTIKTPPTTPTCNTYRLTVQVTNGS